MASITIPLALKTVEVEIGPVEWGDPFVLRIKLPPECLGEAVLPRFLFSDEVNQKTAPNDVADFPWEKRNKIATDEVKQGPHAIKSFGETMKEWLQWKSNSDHKD